VHRQTFEHSQATRVSGYWEGIATEAANMGHTDLWRTAKRTAAAVREQTSLADIDARHREGLAACKVHESAMSDVRWVKAL
jgi:hypothetical protein